MEFNSKANLVEFLYSPSALNKKMQQKALLLAETVIKKLKMVGVLAVEMFVTAKGEIFVNELAPRPHNSGHHTIEGNYTSQYAQHLRAITGLPLGNTHIKQAAVMVNLLGEPGYEGEAIYQNLDKVLSMPGIYVHLYGKKNTRAFRKMGHVTILAKNVKLAMAQARKIKKLLKVTT
jgi:5-(carboxyamino)imidazole ribonucleotide synthase